MDVLDTQINFIQLKADTNANIKAVDTNVRYRILKLVK